MGILEGSKGQERGKERERNREKIRRKRRRGGEGGQERKRRRKRGDKGGGGGERRRGRGRAVKEGERERVLSFLPSFRTLWKMLLHHQSSIDNKLGRCSKVLPCPVEL